ncbi:MAG: TolC family protein [Thermoguttaceae bacterium]
MSLSFAAVRNYFVIFAILPLGYLAGSASAQQPLPEPTGPAPLPPAMGQWGDRGPSIPTPPDLVQPPENLEEAWRVALRADQRLEASRWNINAAESSLGAAQAERFPALRLGSDYYLLSDQPTFLATLPTLGTAELPIADRNGVGALAMVNQPLYTFGRISNGIDAAAEAVKANQAECGRTALDVKMNVAEIYVGTLRTARIVRLAESKVTSLNAHNRDVAGFYDKGVVSRNDLLAAQVALADAQQQALQSQNSLRVAFAAYNRALGRRLDEPVNLAELGDCGVPGDVDELTRQAIQMRPEIAGLAAQMRALDSQAASVRAKRAPQVGLFGGYLYQQNQYVDPNGLGVVGVGVQWTPIDSGRTSHQADALSERAQSVLRLRRNAESMIALEVRQRWLELQTARQRVEVTRQATAQADENIRVARDRYQHQVGTNTEVLDAETLRMQTYTNFYNSTYEAVLAELRLRRAIGNL